MDEADMGNISMEFHLRRKLAEITRPAPDILVPLYCIDCGLEIPDARRKAVLGCVRCVHCQKAAER